MNHTNEQNQEDTDKEAPTDNQDNEESSKVQTTPLEEVVNDLNQMIKNPSSITKDSLIELRDKIEAVKEDVENEEDSSDEIPAEERNGKGILVAIGMPKGGRVKR